MTATAQEFAAAADEPLARFAAALARLNPGNGTLGLAVSGGVDSLALLLLAHRAIPGAFKVASVDHGLRPEAASECALVAEICAARGIACTVLRVEVSAGNLQDRARTARYAALAEWARHHRLVALATAHQADDQAETLVMRLNRASGLAGLAGVRASSVVPGTDMQLIRPLLSFRRRELEPIVAEAGLVPARDPSNEDEGFDRVRVRKALGAGALLDAVSTAAAAAHLAEADAALDWAARREWAERVEEAGDVIRYRPLAPRAVVLRVVKRAITTLGGQPRGQPLAALVDALMAGKGGNLAGVVARSKGGSWIFRPEPVRRSP